MTTAVHCLDVDGMTCASCALSLERSLRRHAGVEDARADFATGRLTVRADAQVSDGEIADLVRGAGYEARAPGPEAKSESSFAGSGPDERALYLRLAVSAFFAMNSMLPGLAVDTAASRGGGGTVVWLGAVSGALAVPAIAYGGAPFFRGALAALRRHELGMDVLVSLGTLSTFAYSVAALVRGSPPFFDTAAMLVTMLLAGRALEAYVRRKSLGPLRALATLLPSLTRVVGADGTREVPTRSVARGKRILVLPGERVPLDGRIVSGAAQLDTSVFTGEWAPRAVGPGDLVEAGTTPVDAPLKLEITRAEGSRAIDVVRASVDALLGERAPIQRLADRAASALSILVIALALLTLAAVSLRHGFGAEAVLRAVAVVVVACPCALGLATPMVVAITAGRAAGAGMTFRDADALERMAHVDRVLVDKTGTLSVGAPHVVRVRCAPGISETALLSLAAAADRGVDHPIARALRLAVGPLGSTDDRVVIVGGKGVILTEPDGAVVLVGSATLLEEQGVSIPPPPARGSSRLMVHVARGSAWLGTIELDDAPRPGAAAALRDLARLGLRPCVVTGDGEASARAMAAALEFDGPVVASVTPVEKAERVALLARRGEHVAFIGDGVNDGPALARAHVGIAVTGATDVAAQSAHVVLFRGGVERVVEAIALARSARARMRQNVIWAIAYNLGALPLAALGKVTPTMAAALMAVSSVSVILNAARRPAYSASACLPDAAPVLDVTPHRLEERGPHA